MTLMTPSLDIILVRLVIIVILALLAGLVLLVCLSILRTCRRVRTEPWPPPAGGESREGAARVDPWREAARRLSIDSPDPESDDFGPSGGRNG